MVISKKVSEKEIQKFIDKGGSVKQDKEKEESFVMTLKMPMWMKDQIQNLIREKAGYSRTSWILRTLEKQLKIEEAGFDKGE